MRQAESCERPVHLGALRSATFTGHLEISGETRNCHVVVFQLTGGKISLSYFVAVVTIIDPSM